MGNVESKMRALLTRLGESDPAKMAGVLKNRGVKSIAAIRDVDLFAAVEQTRAALGMPTAYMMAQAAVARGENVRPDDFADNAPPSTNAKINEMAMGFYAKADKAEAVEDEDVELNTHAPFPGSKSEIDPREIYAQYNAPKKKVAAT